MKRWKDPFPQTPKGFHDRVEQTLRGLEDRDMKRNRRCRKLTLALVAALIALLAIGAVAAVIGNNQLKDELSDAGADEVAALVQEAHVPATGGEQADGFALTVDEIIWEDDDLYLSYSAAVPDDGSRYLLALFTPMLNNEPMLYEGRGWADASFFDGDYQSAMLLGGDKPAECSELLTFNVNPRLRDQANNALYIKAVFLKTDYPFTAFEGWDDDLGFSPASSMSLTWSDNAEANDPFDIYPAEEVEVLKAIDAAAGEDGILTVEELAHTGYAEVVSQKEVRMNLDASKEEQALYNDVAEHEFERDGCQVTVERFRMTHLGASVALRVTAPEGLDWETGVNRCWAVYEPEGSHTWTFLRGDGSPLFAVNQGGTMGGAAGNMDADDQSIEFHLDADGIIPLEGIDTILFVPVSYEGTEATYYMDDAFELKPIFSEAIAEADANATPVPTLTPEEEAAFAEAWTAEPVTKLDKRVAAANWHIGDDNVTVYATEKGTYFHIDVHCSGMRGAHAWAIEDAIAAGKKTCPVCIGGPNAEPTHEPARWEEGEDISTFPDD